MGMVPKKLQGVLWNVKTGKLDQVRNESYIVNQVLSLGSLENLRWLFSTYGNKRIRRVFLRKPQKVYSPSSLNFVRRFILGLSSKKAPDYKYDQTVPRRIG